MTKEEIIEMAKDSGMDLYGLGKDRYRFVHHLEAFAKLVAQHERNACAKIADEYAKAHELHQALVDIEGLVALNEENALEAIRKIVVKILGELQ
jgi:hypothetical protein